MAEPVPSFGYIKKQVGDVYPAMIDNGFSTAYRIREIVTQEMHYIEWDECFGGKESAEQFLAKRGYQKVRSSKDKNYAFVWRKKESK